jgi:hypothetical protein
MDGIWMVDVAFSRAGVFARLGSISENEGAGGMELL